MVHMHRRREHMHYVAGSYFFSSKFLSTSIDWEIPLVLSPFFPLSFISLQQYGPSKAFYNTMESKRFL